MDISEDYAPSFFRAEDKMEIARFSENFVTVYETKCHFPIVIISACLANHTYWCQESLHLAYKKAHSWTDLLAYG
jgi:hypothetical protein